MCVGKWSDYLKLPDRVIADIPQRGASSPKHTCTSFTNRDAFKRFQATPTERDLLPLACNQYQAVLEHLRLPVLYMHIRRGDVLLPFYNKGRNANATSIANVARLYNRLLSESQFGSMVYSTNEVNATYLGSWPLRSPARAVRHTPGDCKRVFKGALRFVLYQVQHSSAKA